jgi:hypothetical protein
MESLLIVPLAALLYVIGSVGSAAGDDRFAVGLPEGVKAVWDLGRAYHETTPTRERISINALWLWQPTESRSDQPPAGNWGYFKVPGCWPGSTDYLRKDSQTVYPHPSWKAERLGAVSAAWYQRPISVPKEWAGRRVALGLEYLNSSAAVYVDGRKAGQLQFPGGELDLTAVCPPGSRHVLSLLVVAKPFHEIMLMFNDTNAAKRGRGEVARRGLCGDVYLAGTPAGPRIGGVKVDTALRKGEITLTTALEGLAPQARYTLRAFITDHGSKVKEFTSPAFQAADLHEGRLTVTEKWKPAKLWDLHTPQNVHEVALSLVEDGGQVRDVAHPLRFGFREFWIDGRDFYLNGTRLFLSALPLDNAQVSAATASYAGAKESLLRLKAVGINFVYTHNYGCEPGSHLGFEEILRAADDVGMLVSLSQPHFAQYDWQVPDAQQNNGYAQHAKFYVRVAGSHPSVVFYSMSHNSTGYDEDMNPELIDGIHSARSQWSANNLKRAVQAEAIVARLDPGRIVYHHSSGNLGSMHTSNFYTNMAPAQELDDWFEHWATEGVKPMFTCEYMVPCTWDWTMYRGWYKGRRTFGNAVVPWEFCIAEWSAQFIGDRAYQVGEEEKKNLRWEAEQFRAGRLWHRWDYPHQVGSNVFAAQHEIIGMYLADNWRAFRTWGLSAISPWEHDFFWSLRGGVDKSRKQLPVDWDNLQRPGFSPDYIGEQYERWDLAFQPSDWVATADGRAVVRNNRPLLAYIGGKPSAFTSKDHNFLPGETVEKQLIVINNSRETVTADCRWSLALPQAVADVKQVSIATGQQERVPLRFKLPDSLAPGKYDLSASVDFGDGDVQKDTFTVDVLPPPAAERVAARIAIFDPKGETAALLTRIEVPSQPVQPGTDLSGYDILVVGKGALGTDGPGPDVGRIRDGLKVILFEQTAAVLERRLGFRVAEYGLRQIFRRVADHPLLAALEPENLRDWRGAATLLPPRLTYATSRTYGGPAVKWCDIEVPRVWRCGNRGNVASVLIEKPARGDFLPILDGGYSLQYSPLMEYREGQGLLLLCQLDVSGRSEPDPAAETLTRNMLRYVAAWKPAARRQAVYAGDPAGRRHLEFSGIAVSDYEGGKLSADQVLVVGGGGGQKLAASAADIAQFLTAGGHLLALGLDQRDAAAILPFQVRMKKAEHVAAYFQPARADSLLAGVGPADVHNRAPRVMPLVAAGATLVGDGVLAKALDCNVVFCQFPPYTLDRSERTPPSFGEQQNLRRTYRRTAFQLARLLANMGVAAPTPLLARFSSPLTAASPEKRWLDSFYLDQPEAWDDPYRFFRW